MRSTTFGLFSSAKEKLAELTAKPSIEAIDGPKVDQPVLPLSEEFVTLQMFKDVRYDPNARDVKGNLVWLEIPKKEKKKRRKQHVALDLAKPEVFLAYLAKSRTAVIASTLKANERMLPALQQKIAEQPDNLYLHACLALLTDDIKGLNLGKLIDTETFLKEQAESQYQVILKAIEVMIELRNPDNLEKIIKILNTRNDYDNYLNLAGLEFKDAQFDCVNLNYIDMRNTVFVNCGIHSSTLRQTNLQAASFTDVTFNHVDLYNANFCKAKFTRFTKDNIHYDHTTFISRKIKLNTDTIRKSLNSLMALEIPPYAIKENIYRNLANKSLKYTIEEKHALLGEMGLHDCFNSKEAEPEYITVLQKNFPTRQKCREQIQRDWEKLSLTISSTLNPKSGLGK